MPSIEENKFWEEKYEWPAEGEEWSQAWGGQTTYLWHETILPRVFPYLSANHLLEIAPGHGRCTEFLRRYARQISAIDLNDACVDACRKRFSANPELKFYVNDGLTFPMIENASIDFAFSWDSLVHVEIDVMESYLRELGRVLKPGAFAFLHHSNLGNYIDPKTKEPTISPDHWRGRSVTYQNVQEKAKAANLAVVTQELVSWIWETELYTDCFTFIKKPQVGEKLREARVIETDIHSEMKRARLLQSLYNQIHD